MHAMYRQNHGFTDIAIGRRHADAPFDDGTQVWGDVVPPFGGVAQPNFADITVLVDTFKCQGSELPNVRTKLQPNAPDPCIDPNFADITADVDAFKGTLYPYAGPVACPP